MAAPLRAELGGALARNEFFLLYQPTIDLQNGAFTGVEALIRWRHPERGDLGPETFIALLEEGGEIADVGRWTLLSACRQGAIWHSKGYRFAVSVNISLRQLDRDDFVDEVQNALAVSGLDPHLLILEFSEHAFARDDDHVRGHLQRLKELGVRLAIDDFVPDDSRWSDLDTFPVDIVKIDRQFIRDVTTKTEASRLVHDLVVRARQRNLQIVASGIEDAEQEKLLQIESVDVGQGFLFSKPHDVEEIDRFLEDFAIFSGKPL